MKKFLRIIPLLLLATLFTVTSVRPVEAKCATCGHGKGKKFHAKGRKGSAKAKRAAAKAARRARKAGAASPAGKASSTGKSETGKKTAH